MLAATELREGAAACWEILRKDLNEHNLAARQTFVNRMVLSVKVIQFISFLPSGSGILGVKQRNP